MSADPEKLRVLVVDDEMRLADSMVGILVASGYDATAVYSAEAAMKQAQRVRPHAVITDIVMGPVSGIELANHLRENHPDCRILLMSGIARQAPSGRETFVQFMPKPVSPEHLLAFVASCVPKTAPAASTNPIGEPA